MLKVIKKFNPPMSIGITISQLRNFIPRSAVLQERSMKSRELENTTKGKNKINSLGGRLS